VPKSVPPRYLALPNAPIGFAQYARAAVRGASTPLEEAIALEHAVATGRRLDPKAPTGSSYGRLQQFLFGAANTAGALVGTDEQFAAGFAVLAREVGLPTRLVVGFILGKPAANGTITVHGGDATVWPEVYFAGAGWVPFAPTPGSGDGTADASLRQSVLQRLSEQASVLPVPPPIAPAPNRSTGPLRPGGPAAHDQRDDSGPSTGALIAIGIVGALVLLLLLLVGLRVLRSARHRHQGAAGAWAELVDLLVLVGHRPAIGDTAPTIAAVFDSTFPAPGPRTVSPATGSPSAHGAAADRIAAAADRDAFAPHRSDTPAEVWHDLHMLRRRARRTLPRYRRVLLRVDPRPLLGSRLR
jgi:Transglutaminase-like superfamily